MVGVLTDHKLKNIFIINIRDLPAYVTQLNDDVEDLVIRAIYNGSNMRFYGPIKPFLFY